MDLEDISGDECLKRYMAATERPLGVLPRLSVTDTQGVVVWQIPPGELYCRFKVNDDPDAHMGGLCAAETKYQTTPNVRNHCRLQHKDAVFTQGGLGRTTKAKQVENNKEFVRAMRHVLEKRAKNKKDKRAELERKTSMVRASASSASDSHVAHTVSYITDLEAKNIELEARIEALERKVHINRKDSKDDENATDDHLADDSLFV